MNAGDQNTDGLTVITEEESRKIRETHIHFTFASLKIKSPIIQAHLISLTVHVDGSWAELDGLVFEDVPEAEAPNLFGLNLRAGGHTTSVRP